LSAITKAQDVHILAVERMMKVPNKIPTRLYGRRAMGPAAGGTIWGGAFSPARGFPAAFPAVNSKAAEPIDKVPSPELAPLDDAAPSISDSTFVPGVIPPLAASPAGESAASLTEAQQPAIPLAESPAEPQGETAPKLVPATPVPYQPEQINGFETELNADGTRSILINSSRITIPDLDILAAIPD
jgi:hypothetical protein